MNKDIKTFIKNNQLIKDRETIVLGLSGGPDSIFLLHLLAEYYKKGTIKLIGAHLDHQWRTDSGKDTEFCKESCNELNVPFVSATAASLNLNLKKGSKEEQGRIMRRYFLETVAYEHKAQLIALAHHAQDQQETFFIRLIRGTTLSGLTGMRPQYGAYIRPLLETNKSDILKYLDDHKIAYLTDPTNVSDEYLRNRIRKRVMPALQECDSRFDQNFTRTMYNLQASEQVLEQLTLGTFQQLASKKNDGYQLTYKTLLQLHPYLQKRILMFWMIVERVIFTPTDTFLDEIIRFLLQPTSKAHTLHQTWKLVKTKDTCYIDHTDSDTSL
ncbi:tRNA lysidine(34) synthetase TilS [Candidatus Babeliales bacterium]|nr:tRNA lysidine(34) synthetase TilS [Candidatus Babeliales bacterium]